LMGRAYKQLYVNAIAPAVKRNQKWLDRPHWPTTYPTSSNPASTSRQSVRQTIGIREGAQVSRAAATATCSRSDPIAWIGVAFKR
jgi:hypothetical protein